LIEAKNKLFFLLIFVRSSVVFLSVISREKDRHAKYLQNPVEKLFWKKIQSSHHHINFI